MSTTGVEELKRIRLQPDDVLIVRIPTSSRAMTEEFGRRLHECFPRNKVVVLGEDVSLEVISGGEIA